MKSSLIACIFVLSLLTTREGYAADEGAGGALKLEVYYSRVILSPVEETKPVEPKVYRAMFKLYLRNTSDHAVRVATKGAHGSDEVDGSRNTYLTVGVQLAPTREILTLSETESRIVEIPPGGMTPLHMITDVNEEAEFKPEEYAFTYEVVEFIGKKLGVWYGTLKPAKMMSEKEAAMLRSTK